MGNKKGGEDKHKLVNPVAKYNNTYNKPKTFRDRKKENKLGENEREHPKHAPYVRCPTNKAAMLEAWEEMKDEDKPTHLNYLLGDWDAT